MKNYIKGKCKTNLDNHNVSEVTVFAEVPKLDSYVTCRRLGILTKLKVVAITHDTTYSDSGDIMPFIIVELNYCGTK